MPDGSHLYYDLDVIVVGEDFVVEYTFRDPSTGDIWDDPDSCDTVEESYVYFVNGVLYVDGEIVKDVPANIKPADYFPKKPEGFILGADINDIIAGFTLSADMLRYADVGEEGAYYQFRLNKEENIHISVDPDGNVCEISIFGGGGAFFVRIAGVWINYPDYVED